MTMAPPGWIAVADIATADLAPDEKINLIATALEEWAVAKALVMMHGIERGARRYQETGGHVAFDGDELVIHLSAARR
jgi:hypothetical protein